MRKGVVEVEGVNFITDHTLANEERKSQKVNNKGKSNMKDNMQVFPCSPFAVHIS